jgi:hypothetical protein
LCPVTRADTTPMTSLELMYEVNHCLTITFLLVIAVFMTRRNLRRQTPIFFSYTVFDAVGMTISYSLMHLGILYPAYYAAWGDHIVCVLLGFAVIAEIFNKMFASYRGIRRFANLAMLWSTSFLIVAAVISAFFHHVADSVPILTFFMTLDRSLSLIQLGLILSLFAVAGYLHLRWRNFLFGVAMGFGFNALIILALNIIRAYYGQIRGIAAFQDFGYLIAVLIWTVYTFQPEAATIPIVSLPSHELEKWDLALSRLLGHATSSSIPAAGE